MRLFVSYARVDKPYCIQIVDTLDVHEIWYDQRLYAGQQWWKEILRRLDWCEGFVYLLSPDSTASDYCRKEFELAQSLGRHIFPVMIQDNTPVPTVLKEVQYADLSKGLTPEAVKILLNSIYIAERQKQSQAQGVSVSVITSDDVKPPQINPATVISAAASAMEKGQFDHAVFLLKQAKANGFTSRFIKIDAILAEAETALDRQAYLREAEREYKQIAELVHMKRTRNLGCEAFRAFNKDYPDYDPDCLGQTCGDTPAPTAYSATTERIEVSLTPTLTPAPTPPPAVFSLPLLEWCEIPAGIVSVEEINPNGQPNRKPYFVDMFGVSKYPVTNAQYECFLQDPMGYANLAWWQFSSHAHAWRMNNPQPKPSRFKGDERPRETVNWYDALAFCNWLSARTSMTITLPTQAQWQRAARGDDNRLFPWGDNFDPNRCNARESEIKMTTLVMRYPNGISPYGVYDMTGNVWEWCLNAKSDHDNHIDITSNEERAVHGGSFVSVHQRSQISFHYHLNPQTYYASIGFRVVHLA
jgi:formylglycine-generating enzyme required for sulfatase activity